jgi:hypothetical protein
MPKINKSDKKKYLRCVIIIAIVSSAIIIGDGVLLALFYFKVRGGLQSLLGIIVIIASLFQILLVYDRFEKALKKIRAEAVIVLLGTVAVFACLVWYSESFIEEYNGIVLSVLILKAIIDCFAYFFMIRKTRTIQSEECGEVKSGDFYKDADVNIDDIDRLSRNAKQHYIFYLLIPLNLNYRSDNFFVLLSINIVIWAAWSALELRKFRLFFKPNPLFIKSALSLVPVLFALVAWVLIKFYTQSDVTTGLLLIFTLVSLIRFNSINKKIYAKILWLKEKRDEEKIAKISEDAVEEE